MTLAERRALPDSAMRFAGGLPLLKSGNATVAETAGRRKGAADDYLFTVLPPRLPAGNVL